MMEGSPQTFLHDPIVDYLKQRGVQINLNSRIADLIYDMDKTGTVPTRVNGIVLSGMTESLGNDGDPKLLKEAAQLLPSLPPTRGPYPDGSTRSYLPGKGDGAPEERRTFDVVVAACDVPGIQKLLPQSFRTLPEFDNIYRLEAVPVSTVQLRFNGWVTELQDKEKMRKVRPWQNLMGVTGVAEVPSPDPVDG